MKSTLKCLAAAVALSVLALGTAARAQVLVTDFNFFLSDALYASWVAPSAVIESGENSYKITATGYGSNYKYVNVIAPGSTHLELEITLSGPPAANGQLGPIISFVDDDGSYYNYAFYGQMLGDHVLRAPLAAPTSIQAAGTVAGLNLSALPHMHMQLDPAQFGATGAYTLEWKNLTLITAGAGDFDGDGDVDGSDLLLWQRDPRVGSLGDWKANFGAPPMVSAATVHGIPEPATAGMLALGSLGLALRMRRRRSA